MNEKELAEIKARAEAATPGPWLMSDQYYIHDPNKVAVGAIRSCNYTEEDLICEVRYPFQMQHEYNGRFIANARTDIPALLAEVERLRAETEHAKQYAADCNALLIIEAAKRKQAEEQLLNLAHILHHAEDDEE